MKKKKKFLSLPTFLIFQTPFLAGPIVGLAVILSINFTNSKAKEVFVISYCVYLFIIFLLLCFALRWQRVIIITKEGIELKRKNKEILCRWNDFETIEKITNDGGKLFCIVKVTYKNGEKIYFDYTKSMADIIQTLCDDNNFKMSIQNSNGHLLFEDFLYYKYLLLLVLPHITVLFLSIFFSTDAKLECGIVFLVFAAVFLIITFFLLLSLTPNRQKIISIIDKGIMIKSKKKETLYCWGDYLLIKCIKFRPIFIIRITYKNGEKIYFDSMLDIYKLIKKICNNDNFKKDYLNIENYYDN